MYKQNRYDRIKTVINPIILGMAFCAQVLLLRAQNAPNMGLTDRGETVYRDFCETCHGEVGDGNGPAAEYLNPRPRDFTRGKFKIRSTESRQLPTDEDLFNTVTNGLPGTWMPPWDNLSEENRWAVVAYIKTFSKQFDRSISPPKKIELIDKVPYSDKSATIGKQVYKDIECFKCHGSEGRGDGESASDLVDEWNNPTLPPDLTKSWNFRGGSSVDDLFKRFIAGLDGTPMPSIIESFVIPEEIEDIAIKMEDGEPVTADEREKYEAAKRDVRIKTWHLTNYVNSLERQRNWFDWLFHTDPEGVYLRQSE